MITPKITTGIVAKTTYDSSKEIFKINMTETHIITGVNNADFKITFKNNLEDFLIRDSCADVFDYTYYKFGNDINFDNDMLTKFDISSKEAQNSLIAKQKGIYLGDIFEDDDKVEVYLKNSDVIFEILSYSKKFKTLFLQKFYSTAKTKPIFNSIATKNGKYFRVEYKYKK